VVSTASGTGVESAPVFRLEVNRTPSLRNKTPAIKPLYQPYATGGNRKAVYYTLHQIAFILMPTEGVIMVPEITYGKLNYSNLATKQG
jgi:hypothetical protein